MALLVEGYNIFSIDQFKAHSKTALELFYLETGSIPIRYILMSRRLNFLWYLVHQKEDSLLSNFFRAQCEDPIRGDWVSQVRADMESLDLVMTFEDIRAIPKDTFKELVKKHVRATAFAGLKEIQESHSKSKKLKYNEMKMNDYLAANTGMTRNEKSFAFCARSHMLNVKKNFKFGKTDLKCSLGCDTMEDQEHILQCPVLKEENENHQINYTDIYSNDPCKVKNVTLILKRKFDKFTKLNATVHGQSSQTGSSAAESENIVDDVNTLNDNDIVDYADFELE